MTPETATLQQLANAVEELRGQVSELGRRVSELEAGAAGTLPRQTVADERLSEELVLTISAAIAAYLGVKPRIRQIRLLGGATWAQQGRATIQASHSLAVHHG